MGDEGPVLVVVVYFRFTDYPQERVSRKPYSPRADEAHRSTAGPSSRLFEVAQGGYGGLTQ